MKHLSCVDLYCLVLTIVMLGIVVMCCPVMSCINRVVSLLSSLVIGKEPRSLPLTAPYRMSGVPSNLVPFLFDCDTYFAPVQVLIESGKTAPTMMQLDVNAQGQKHA